MNLKKHLTLVTVSYNSAHIMESHLNGMGDSPIDDKPRHIVVDNASSDGSVEFIKNCDPSVEVIANSDNRGFGTACNQGINSATTRYVIILNPDTQLSHSALTTLLVALQEEENAAIAGPKVDSDSTKTGTEVVRWVIGAAVLMDKEKLKEIGYFDENIFLYYEENDLYLRVQAAGMDVIKCHDSFMPHIGGASSAESPELNTFLSWHRGRSHRIVAAKHPDHFISVEDYLKKQRRSLLRAKLTFNKRRRLDAAAKIAGASSEKLHP